MIDDRDLLDLIAEDAPTARTGFTDEVVSRGRRSRRRLRVARSAAVGIAGLVCLVLVVGPLSREREAAVWPQSRPSPASADPAAEPYAVAIKTVIDRHVIGDPRERPPNVLYVMDHTCADVEKRPPSLTCTGEPLSAALRRDLERALRSYTRVEFVRDHEGTTDDDHGLAVKNGGVQVTLGPIRIADRQAEVSLAVRRNGLNGTGVVYRLLRDNDRWAADKAVRGGWIA